MSRMSLAWFQDQPSVLPAPQSARRLRVLLVEDEPDTARSLVLWLRHWGYDVAAVLDGRHAVEVAATFRPHVALMDLALPGMDGYEVAGRLRDAPGLADMHCIAVSGYSRDEGERR